VDPEAVPAKDSKTDYATKDAPLFCTAHPKDAKDAKKKTIL